MNTVTFTFTTLHRLNDNTSFSDIMVRNKLLLGATLWIINY